MKKKGIDIESLSRNSGEEKGVEHFYIVKFSTKRMNEFSSRVGALKFAEKLAEVVKKL